MGNTQSPCDKCKYLYYDCMYVDDPNYEADCVFSLEIGRQDCPQFRKWDTAANLKDVPFPECADTCGAVDYLGVGECESVCPHKFQEEDDADAPH